MPLIKVFVVLKNVKTLLKRKINTSEYLAMNLREMIDAMIVAIHSEFSKMQPIDFEEFKKAFDNEDWEGWDEVIESSRTQKTPKNRSLLEQISNDS